MNTKPVETTFKLLPFTSDHQTGLYLEFLVSLFFVISVAVDYKFFPYIPLIILAVSIIFSIHYGQSYNFESHLNPIVTITKIYKDLFNNKLQLYYLLILFIHVGSIFLGTSFVYSIQKLTATTTN